MSGHVMHSRPCVRETTSVTHRIPASGWLAALTRMLRTMEERRILASLDDRMLSDIGVNRLEAGREAARAPWDIQSRV